MGQAEIECFLMLLIVRGAKETERPGKTSEHTYILTQAVRAAQAGTPNVNGHNAVSQ